MKKFAADDITRLELQPLAHGARWRVWHAGAVLVENTRDPEHAAARALLERGINGRAETYSMGGTVARIRFDIATKAQFAMDDGKTLRRVRWRSMGETARMRVASPRAHSVDLPLGKEKLETAADAQPSLQETAFQMETEDAQ